MMSSVFVLLVEDDERLGTFTAEYLTGRGLNVVHVTDGEQAIVTFHNSAFDVVVLDVMLPGRNGLSVCKAIRSSSDVPILLVTARGEESDRILGLELGGDDYIVKPFSPRELLARIKPSSEGGALSSFREVVKCEWVHSKRTRLRSSCAWRASR